MKRFFFFAGRGKSDLFGLVGEKFSGNIIIALDVVRSRSRTMSDLNISKPISSALGLTSCTSKFELKLSTVESIEPTTWLVAVLVTSLLADSTAELVGIILKGDRLELGTRIFSSVGADDRCIMVGETESLPPTVVPGTNCATMLPLRDCWFAFFPEPFGLPRGFLTTGGFTSTGLVAEGGTREVL